jgi:hypothetical protein
VVDWQGCLDSSPSTFRFLQYLHHVVINARLDAPSRFESHAVANFVEALTLHTTNLETLHITIASDKLTENDCGWYIVPTHHPIFRVVERMVKADKVPHLVLRLQDGAKWADGWASDIDDLFYEKATDVRRSSLTWGASCSCPAFKLDDGACGRHPVVTTGLRWQQRIHGFQPQELEATRWDTSIEILRLERYEQEGAGIAGSDLKDEYLAAFDPFSDGGDGLKQQKITDYFQPADSEPFPRPELDFLRMARKRRARLRDYGALPAQ